MRKRLAFPWGHASFLFVGFCLWGVVRSSAWECPRRHHRTLVSLSFQKTNPQILRREDSVPYWLQEVADVRGALNFSLSAQAVVCLGPDDPCPLLYALMTLEQRKSSGTYYDVLLKDASLWSGCSTSSFPQEIWFLWLTQLDEWVTIRRTWMEEVLRRTSLAPLASSYIVWLYSESPRAQECRNRLKLLETYIRQHTIRARHHKHAHRCACNRSLLSLWASGPN